MASSHLTEDPSHINSFFLKVSKKHTFSNMPCSGQLTFSTLNAHLHPFPCHQLLVPQYITFWSAPVAHPIAGEILKPIWIHFAFNLRSAQNVLLSLRKISLSLLSYRVCDVLSPLFTFSCFIDVKTRIYYPDKQWEEFHIVHIDLMYHLRGVV